MKIQKVSLLVVYISLSLSACQKNSEQSSKSVIDSESSVDTVVVSQKGDLALEQDATDSGANDTALKANANTSSDLIGQIAVSKQTQLEYKQLMQATQLIKSKHDSNDASNFSDNSKQIEKDIVAIKALEFGNPDIIQLKNLMLKFLEKNKELNDMLMNSKLDNIQVINQEIQNILQAYEELNQKITKKYHLQ